MDEPQQDQQPTNPVSPLDELAGEQVNEQQPVSPPTGAPTVPVPPAEPAPKPAETTSAPLTPSSPVPAPEPVIAPQEAMPERLPEQTEEQEPPTERPLSLNHEASNLTPSATAESSAAPHVPKVNVDAVYPSLESKPPTSEGVYQLPEHPEPVPPEAQEMPRDRIRIMVIRIIGGVIILGAVFNLILSSTYLAKHGDLKGSTSLFAILDILLGVGIFLRRNLARYIFITLTIIGIIVGLIGVQNYNKSIQREHVSYQAALVESQKLLVQYEHSTTLSAHQKATLIQQIQQQQQVLRNPPKASGLLTAELSALALPVLGCVFLLLPGTGRLFSWKL